MALICLALAIAVLAASASAVHSAARAAGALGEPAPDQVLWRNVLIDIRLPRVLFAVVAGRAWRPAPPCRRCSAIRWPSRA